MKAEKKYPYAIITTRNPSWARSSHFRRKVEFNGLDHARNYCRVAVKPDWFRIDGKNRNLNKVTKITVWIGPNLAYIWNKGVGWQQWTR